MRPSHRPRNLARAALLAVCLAVCAPALAAAQDAPAAGPPGAPNLVVPGDATALVGDSAWVDSATAGDLVAEPAEPPPDHVAEVRASFTPENRAYASMRVFLAFLDPVYSITVALLVLFSGLAARLRDIAHGLGHRRYVRMLVFLLLYMGVGFVLTFPLTWYRGFALEHQFGLSNETFGSWFGDQLKGEATSLVIFGFTGLLALAYGQIERSPKRWWLTLGLGTLPVILVLALIQPVLIDPLFNKFEPLSNRELETRIVTLAERAGIPGRNVYQVDKSRQTKKINAYVSGFGPSQRIVLWDNTLEQASEDEILFIMGHEMGHYALHHIWKGIALSSALAFLVLFLARLVMGWAIARFGERWGIRALHDVATVPLLAATLTLLLFLLQPLTNAFSRSIEHEADVFALEVTHTNDAGARAFIKLAAANRSDPEPPPAVAFFLYTHPPLIERIRFALAYRPWEERKPNQVFRGEP
jgi:Zn-dependent protease with chaperone function